MKLAILMPDLNEAVDLADILKQFSNSLSSFDTSRKSSIYAFKSLSDKKVKLKEVLPNHYGLRSIEPKWRAILRNSTATTILSVSCPSWIRQDIPCH
jgi:hypothetical protein